MVCFVTALGVGLCVGGRGGEGADAGNSTSAATSAQTTFPSLYTSTPVVPSSETPWQPEVSSTWQIVLQEPLDLPGTATSVTPDVDISDIDLFTNSKQTVGKLHSLGKKVICYFSAGSSEEGRPDSDQFMASDRGKELDGWPGAYWLDLKSDNVRSIMSKRIALAADKGCDAIGPDNIDGYSNVNGLNLTKQDSIDFVHYLADEAHKFRLSIGLKNAGSIIPRVLNTVAFSVNEQCAQYQECGTFHEFIAAGKPVFNIEYEDQAYQQICSESSDVAKSSAASDHAAGFSSLLKNVDLDGEVRFCNGETANTPTSSG